MSQQELFTNTTAEEPAEEEVSGPNHITTVAPEPRFSKSLVMRAAAGLAFVAVGVGGFVLGKATSPDAAACEAVLDQWNDAAEDLAAAGASVADLLGMSDLAIIAVAGGTLEKVSRAIDSIDTVREDSSNCIDGWEA